ncbi:MAG: glycosyltransferase WbuB, partial [Bacteroidetes bacterium]
RRALAFVGFWLRAWLAGRAIRGVDAVLAYTAPLSVAELGRRLARFHRVPFFLEVADVWPDVPVGMGILKNPLLIRYLYRKTDHIYREAVRIFPFSPGMCAQIEAHGVSSEKITLIHNGVQVSKVPFRVRTPVEGRPFRLLYAGTLGIANDVSQLVRAFRQARQEYPDMELTLLGDGNDARRVQEEIDHDPEGITLLASVPRAEALKYLDQADAGLVIFAPYPVLEANAATKFYDYLAAGLPVLLNYEGWQAAYIEEYCCGLSSPQGDEAALAEAILRIVRESALRETFSRNGRRLAEEQFDRKKELPKLVRCVSERD